MDNVDIEVKSVKDVKTKYKYSGLFALMIIIVFIMIVYLSNKNNPQSNETSAFVYAQHIVENELLSPSTAIFASFGESRITPTMDDYYLVESYVDAENEYGAKLRKTFSVKIKLMNDTFDWKELNIK